MTFQIALAYLHILSFVGLFAVLAMELALCRPDWLNGAVVTRLARIDAIYAICAGLALTTGLARVFWGTKGAEWYWANGLLHVKLGLFILVALLSIYPTIAFLRWRKNWLVLQQLPSSEAIRKVRRVLMVEVHIATLIPLLGVLLARGYGG